MEKTGMKNIYVCEKCGGGIVTINRDDGTTPFMIMCRAKDGCGGVMRSQFYPSNAVMFVADWEWFRPVSTKGYSPEMKDHIKNGGLVLRKIGADVSAETKLGA